MLHKMTPPTHTLWLQVNNLALIGSEVAQDAIASFVELFDSADWPNEVTLGIARIKEPVGRLLDAMAYRLEGQPKVEQATSIESDDSKLLLAATALAAHARNKRNRLGHVAMQIDQIVKVRLEEALKVDRDVWASLHNRSWQQVDYT